MLKKIVFTCLIIFSLRLVNGQIIDSDYFPDIQGWERLGEIREYNPDNLFDYINGAAELFLHYNFNVLNIQEYIKGNTNIKVEIYQHKSPLYAFGMYSQERYPDSDFMDIGAQAYGNSDYLNFVKDRYYIKLIGSKSDLSQLKLIAEQVAGNLPGNNELPDELNDLPSRDKIDHTEKFIADSFMGLSFMNNVMMANYTNEGNDFTVFIMYGDNSDKSKKTIESYYEFADKSPKKIKTGFHKIEDPYNGTVFLQWEDDLIWGVMGLDSKKISKEYIQMTQGNI